MDIGLLFWIIMVVALLFGGWSLRSGTGPVWGNSLLTWVLFFLVGWKIFGFVIRG